MKKILIIGYGNIGKHMFQELKTKDTEIEIYDKFIETFSLNWVVKKDFDFAFICVPTEKLEDGSCDISAVIDSIYTIKDQFKVDTIVVKSTVPVGTMDEIKKITENKYNLVFSPEYYGTTIHAPKTPNFVILAGDKDDCSKVAELYYQIKDKNFRIRFTDYKTAELAKYMENCFLALKVTFCSEFATIAKEFNISYPELREIFILDERMGDSHTFVNPEKPYYDSHCLNKDIPGLIAQTDKAHLMKAIDEINKNKKENINY